MKKGNLIIYKGQKHGTLYMVEVSEEEANTVEGVGTSTLCHKIFVHMSGEGMRKHVSSGRILDSKICDRCF